MKILFTTATGAYFEINMTFTRKMVPKSWMIIIIGLSPWILHNLEENSISLGVSFLLIVKGVKLKGINKLCF